MTRTHIPFLALLAVTLGGCLHRPPTPAPPSVDVLDFLIGDTATWPRRGTQEQNQIVDREHQRVCWTKYGRAAEFECWRWDNRWVYHEVDHAIDGRPGESYHFSDGRWLPRRLAAGKTWTLDVLNNVVTWYTSTCAVDAVNTRRFPYQLRVSLFAAQDLGALGVREVLVLEYGPHALGAEPAAPERFYFARGAGWFLWTSARGTARFDRVGGPAVNRTKFCGEP